MGAMRGGSVGLWAVPLLAVAACSTNAAHSCPDGAAVDVAVSASDVVDASVTDVVDVSVTDVVDAAMADVVDAARADVVDAPEPLAPVSAVAAGTLHTCALRGGRVFCWGDNTTGQLGVPTITRSVTPVEVPGIRDAAEVAVDGNASCARHLDGTVSCWGQSISGQLGTGVPVGRDLVPPTRVPGVRDATALVLGSGYTCVVFLGGAVSCWGSNRNHQLGDGMGGGEASRAAAAPVTGLNRVVQLAAGQFSCAVREDGKVLCWGLNFAGETASATAPTRTPEEVPGVSNAVNVGVGSGFGCAVVQSGQVYCWGDNRLGQLGDRPRNLRMPPEPVPGITDASRLAVGWTNTCALRRDGTVSCWGQGTHGELGAGMMDQTSPTPVAVPGLDNVVQLVGFAPVSNVLGNHRCALRRSDTDRLWCWGYNSDGQVGDGTMTDRASPVRASAVP